ncbi:MAG TPA: gamma-glutamyltransferase [Flavobacteriales bacterium]|nr:gamma-glutamyltransferase [Flavobacteriales bacterium]HRP82911.1 gamma-glutamyltransferase [Flavobacteriales bacterium]HRQ85148.1 gamma-glutamyltransferase [Flavobacteriales bacterium]
MQRLGLFAAALPISLLLSCGTAGPQTPIASIHPAAPAGLVRADSGMVVSAHPLASAIGERVLREGGNAVDAAIAVHWALAVTTPWAGNIGGGGFMVVRLADGRTASLDFREAAPAAARHNMYVDQQGQVVPGLSEYGHLAPGVPGSVAGLFALHDSLGSLPMARLIQPAIDLAAAGCPLTGHEAHELNAARPLIGRHSTRPNAFTSRSSWAAGDTLRQPELAHTLERIRDGGAEEFSKGLTARLLVEEMRRGGGLITAADLATYHPRWRPPLQGTFQGMEVITMGPPSSGGILLLQMLRGMETADPSIWTGGRPALLHRMIEVERRAFADRAEYLGDPDFVRVPVQELIAHEYVDARMADIDPSRATSSTAIRAGSPVPEAAHTTHFSIVDPMGNAVSCTTTLNGAYGCGVVVGGAGFLLNNEMDDFSAAPGAPNAYGLIGGEANSIAPHKRMLSSMAPTIVTRNGRLFMVAGSPGGSTIPTTVFQVLLNVVHHGMDMQQAVSAFRFHHQWLPDTVRAEIGAIQPADSMALVEMGHVIRIRHAIGRADAILVHPDGTLEGGADPRGDDRAMGF